jgi:hypothetical protein
MIDPASQSRRMSLVEASANVAIGYAIAVVAQIVIFPWFGIAVGLPQHLGIGAAFTVVSLVRSYVLRRCFERWRGACIRGASWAHEAPNRNPPRSASLRAIRPSGR